MIYFLFVYSFLKLTNLQNLHTYAIKKEKIENLSTFKKE